MGKIASQTFRLKNGLIGIIRSPEPGESGALVSNGNLLNLPGSWLESLIVPYLNHPQKILLVPFIDGSPAGLLNFEPGNMGISVVGKFRNMGLGALMLQTLLKWAKENSEVEKIDLKVDSSNQAALALYKKFGFIEGKRIGNCSYMSVDV